MKTQVRIIGGQWRGRKLPVIDVAGLRPTPDRIRETLFNWLRTRCRNAEVLDCFAGSGALVFEAMSRGAGSAIAIEQCPLAADALNAICDHFAADNCRIIEADAVSAVQSLQQQFDIIFIDPPYAEPQLRQQVFQQLETHDCLKPGAWIYFEWPAAERFELPSAHLHCLKQKKAGKVNYAIAEWQGSR